MKSQYPNSILFNENLICHYKDHQIKAILVGGISGSKQLDHLRLEQTWSTLTSDEYFERYNQIIQNELSINEDEYEICVNGDIVFF